MLATVTNYALLAFFTSALWAPVLIGILYRFNIVTKHKLMRNKMNEEFMKIHGHKNRSKSGTPRSGGLIISVPVFFLTLFFIPMSPLRDVFLFGWAVFALYGLSDDLLVSARKMSDKFRLFQETFGWRMFKLLLLFSLVALSVLLMRDSLGISQITLIGDLVIPLNILTIPLISFAAAMAMYGIEITDGADGLDAGLFLIALTATGVLAVTTQTLAIIPFLGLMLGATIVYLYFNINPARVFMGGSGTFPTAFALIFFSFVMDSVLVFLIMGTLFWIELASSFIQIVAIRFFKRKVFRIAPIHHHFEAIGWPEAKVVQRFWLGAVVAALFALWVFSLLNR